MIHSYKFKNFFSFKNETEVSFQLKKSAIENGMTVLSESGQYITKVVAVIGANGSGKTNLLKPLAFLKWFVSSSFQSDPSAKLPLEPHFFSDSNETEFEVEFSYDGRLWRYGLVANAERVLHESLHVKATRLFSTVFNRTWLNNSLGYRIKQYDFGFNQKEAVKVRANASLIATAAQYQVPLATELAAFSFSTNVINSGREHYKSDHLLLAADYFAGNLEDSSRMSSLLRSWDLGLSEVQIKEIDIPMENGKTKKIPVPYGVHRDGKKEAERLLFDESSGTQSAFVLLGRILPVLANGGLAVIDEFEADLHPHMLIPILDLFISQNTNPHNAQIIFTTHSVEIINLLHKAQVILVEKDDACCSEAWRIDSIQGVRNDDNLYAKYMAGAYGAIPNL